MNNLQVNIEKAFYFAGQEDFNKILAESDAAIEKVNNGSGEGSDFLGWTTLPSDITKPIIDRINEAAADMRKCCDYVVVTGIGGSYLGAKAVISALGNNFEAYKKPGENNPKVIFAGQNLSQDYLYEMMELLSDYKFGVIVISKSGTTTEPAVAFRILKEELERKFGKEEASRRIIAITDSSKGALRTLADKEGYLTFEIPDNVGGRFSVLTPVGLLPIAVAGYDIDKLIAGAAEMQQRTLHAAPDNPAQIYAAVRNALYRKGKKIEILVNFNPKLHFFAEWWKQLFGESEGKDGKGIFPASVDFTTDLHSMGQWIQDGERTIFETVINVASPRTSLLVPSDKENTDGLNYLAGRPVEDVNAKAEEGTIMAHVEGGVPVIKISVPSLDEYHLGQLIYFFEKACGISGYLLGVNPFNQPGVEKYKSNMFKLLGKPGY